MFPDDLSEDQVDALPLASVIAVDARAVRKQLAARLTALPYPAYPSPFLDAHAEPRHRVLNNAARQVKITDLDGLSVTQFVHVERLLRDALGVVDRQHRRESRGPAG